MADEQKEIVDEQRVSVGGTGDGRIKQMTITTPEGQANIIVNLVPTALGLLFGFIETFLTGLLSTATVASISNQLIPFADFAGLVRVAASVALTGAALGTLKDLVVIVGQLKKRWPVLGA